MLTFKVYNAFIDTKENYFDLYSRALEALKSIGKASEKTNLFILDRYSNGLGKLRDRYSEVSAFICKYLYANEYISCLTDIYNDTENLPKDLIEKIIQGVPYTYKVLDCHMVLDGIDWFGTGGASKRIVWGGVEPNPWYSEITQYVPIKKLNVSYEGKEKPRGMFLTSCLIVSNEWASPRRNYVTMCALIDEGDGKPHDVAIIDKWFGENFGLKTLSYYKSMYEVYDEAEIISKYHAIHELALRYKESLATLRLPNKIIPYDPFWHRNNAVKISPSSTVKKIIAKQEGYTYRNIDGFAAVLKKDKSNNCLKLHFILTPYADRLECWIEVFGPVWSFHFDFPFMVNPATQKQADEYIENVIYSADYLLKRLMPDFAAIAGSAPAWYDYTGLEKAVIKI